MITPISQDNNTTKTSILYMNDFHAKLPNLERLYTASQAFDSFESSADKLKLSSGDDALGEDVKINKVVNRLLDMIGIQVRENGNHEFDVKPTSHAEHSQLAKHKELGAVNIHLKDTSVLNNVLSTSVVEERNGHKYGIVGVGPSDMKHRLKAGVSMDDMEVDDIETTIVNLQKEVDKLKAQGLDKIILLSHSGYTNDIRFAKETSGIDIILGGHSHDLIKDIEAGKNLFTNKDGEPVIITQAGKDGEHFGVLNVEFNDKGIITKAQNNVIPTKNFNRTLQAKYAVEEIIGRPEHIGHIKSAPPAPANRLIENNPHGNFVVDAMRHGMNTDIALLNSANIRGAFERGKIDSRMVTEISPFKNNMIVAEINEKELVDAIKWGGTSFNKPGNKPGIMLVSGLKYTMNKQGELLNMTRITNDGHEIPIDINNPDTNKKYSVAMDDFVGTGGDGFKSLNKKDVAKEFHKFDKDKLTMDYIKYLGADVTITDDHRIQIV